MGRGCLPTVGVLALKRVVVDALCPWCYTEVETDVHALFGCGFAKSVWQASEVKMMIQVGLGDTASEILKRCFSVCTREPCVFIAMIGWRILNRRNNWVWNRANGSVFGVLAAACNLLHDWREAQLLATPSGNLELSSVLRKWRKPPDGWVKINCDASGVVNGCIGIGCVIQDS